MRRSRRLLLVCVGLAAAWRGLLAVRAVRSGLTWGEMDWDGSGRTSLGEFLNAGDVDTRPIDVGGRACTEIYRLKDGSAAKVVCPAS
jgi:hypothetical protein